MFGCQRMLDCIMPPAEHTYDKGRFLYAGIGVSHGAPTTWPFTHACP
jgi:hypothetical protein